MKKYIIREIGWVYNDSTYERDAAYSTIEIFEDKEMAEQWCKTLNRAYFFEHL